MNALQKRRLYSRLFTLKTLWKNVLYVHIPFCIQRCDFCVYLSKVPSGRPEVATFLQGSLIEQLKGYHAGLTQARFDELYFGGGTPTVLSCDDFDRIFEHIPAFDRIRFKATEASPKTIRDEHIAFFSERGFQYISIGVQSRNQLVLSSHNREIVSEARIRAIIHSIESRGIICNVDLIFFLTTGTIADITQAEQDLWWVANELHPTSITVHSEYHAEKTLEKQVQMLAVLRRVCEGSDYTSVNSFLDLSDADADLRQGAEYRLMKNRHELSFYLSGRLPTALRFGYNILGVGEYDRFTVRSNYLYVSDAYPSHLLPSVFVRSLQNEKALNRTRQQLGIDSPRQSISEVLFSNPDEEARFVEALKSEGLSNFLHASIHRKRVGCVS